MKPVQFALIVLVVVFSGCCTKKMCLFPQGVSLSFHGYDTSDVDTFYLTGYQANTDFKTVTRERFPDSVQYHSRVTSGDPDEQTPFNYYLDTEHDWELFIPATNQTYRFRYYDIGRQKCNSCFLARDMEPVLEGFNVNGVQHSGSRYEVHK